MSYYEKLLENYKDLKADYAKVLAEKENYEFLLRDIKILAEKFDSQ